jgi:hypothetical protein
LVITTTDIQLFQILKLKLGEKEAEALVTFVANKTKESNQNNLKVLATKEDISLLKIDIAKLELKISESKVETLRWVFSFFVALMLAIVGLYFKN